MAFKLLILGYYLSFMATGLANVPANNEVSDGQQGEVATNPNPNLESSVDDQATGVPSNDKVRQLEEASTTNMEKDSQAVNTPAAMPQNPAIVDTLMGITLLGSEWVLWLLLLLSVVSLAVMFDRMYYFYRIRIDFDSFLEKLTPLLNAGKEDEVSKLCEEHTALEAVIAKEAIASKSQGPDAIEKGTTSHMVRSRTKMEKGLTFLGTMGNNAPFIGLFGTVLGIIKAFEDLSLNPAGGPAVVMAGISEALIATAVGLFVAIPAVIAFNWFGRIVNQKMSNAEAVQNIMMKHYSSK